MRNTTDSKVVSQHVTQPAMERIGSIALLDDPGTEVKPAPWKGVYLKTRNLQCEHCAYKKKASIIRHLKK